MWLHFLQKIQTFAPLCRIVPEHKNNACISIAICLFIRLYLALLVPFYKERNERKERKCGFQWHSHACILYNHTFSTDVKLCIKYSTCLVYDFGHSFDVQHAKSGIFEQKVFVWEWLGFLLQLHDSG